TLICASTANRFIEVTPEGETVSQVDITDLVPPSATAGATFRAMRFPVNYDGFRGTDLFHAAPTLVNTASMRVGPSAPAALVTAWGEGLVNGTGASATNVEITDSSGRQLTVSPFHLSTRSI